MIYLLTAIGLSPGGKKRKEKYLSYIGNPSGCGGLGVACWPLVPKFAGSNPVAAVGFLRTKKSLGEVKPSVPCPRFAACKRFLMA